jgi:antibiotic biosynthesis monooxygenase (ABM) superfamily enzyme
MSYDEPVTVVLTRHVPVGREQAMRELLDRAARAASTFPGHLGVTVLRDGRRGALTVVFRFATLDRLRAWETSSIRAKLASEADELGGTAEQVALTGLEAFFRSGSAPPPRWKMALLTWAVVFPSVQVLAAAFAPLPVPAVAKGMALSVVLVALMTWVLMPLVTRWLSTWLAVRVEEKAR